MCGFLGRGFLNDSHAPRLWWLESRGRRLGRDLFHLTVLFVCVRAAPVREGQVFRALTAESPEVAKSIP